jgi:hypothetical protein
MRTLGAALCFIVLASTAHAACVLKLTSPSGQKLMIAASAVVGVLDCPGCGGQTATMVNTLGLTYYVRESPEDVSQRLEAALKEGCAPK